MQELKIVCQCGQKYKFDVEPVNGKMPFTVQCPICKVDGTGHANELLAHQYAVPPKPALPPGFTMIQPATAASAPPPPPRPVSAAAPMPAGFNAPPPVAAPPLVAAGMGAAPPPGGLKINKEAQAAPATTSVAPVAPAGDNNAPPAIGAARPFAVAAAQKSPVKTYFGMGVLGGFIGALVGVAIYFLIFKYTGLRLRILAIGVGALAGWLADFMGKGEGSKELGGITAVLVVVGLIGAQYFVALGWWHEGFGEITQGMNSLYDNAVIEAKAAVKAVPTGSDSEIRAYLAKQQAEDGGKADPASITDDDVKQFRDNELPQDKKLASGQLTRDQFNEQTGLNILQTKLSDESSDNTFKSFFLLTFWRVSNLIALAIAAGTAFKLSSNARGG